ncbi:MAG: hypothetical protein K0R79_246 [Stenotrophomonas indicatrix]|jgi:hypothetical protein|nr:hypothetical protein [Stenotrophomonas indicatrix]MDN8657561.1 hypothetical protein [Stenotrophomonas indicatrix]
MTACVALLRAANVGDTGASCSSIAAMAWPLHACAHTVGKLAMMAAALH